MAVLFVLVHLLPLTGWRKTFELHVCATRQERGGEKQVGEEVNCGGKFNLLLNLWP